MAVVAVEATIEFKSSQLLEVMGLPLPPGDQPISVAIGLEREGDVLLKPFCPPYSKDMEEAVLAFVAYKFALGSRTFRDGGVATGWNDAATVPAGIPNYPDQTIAATIAYCNYVHLRVRGASRVAQVRLDRAGIPGTPRGPGLLRSLLSPRGADPSASSAPGSLIAREKSG